MAIPGFQEEFNSRIKIIVYVQRELYFGTE